MESQDANASVAKEVDPLARYRRQQRITLIVIVLAFVVIALFVGGFLWLFTRSQNQAAAPQVVSYESYRSAWESAMAKVGVEATFPDEPVALTDIRATGVQEFSASFTAEEIAALLTMYPFGYDVQGSTLSLASVIVGFPADGRGSIDCQLVYDGSRYQMQAEGPAEFTSGRVVITPEATALKVEGFGVKGDKRAQAVDLIANYLNALVQAAPRLEVDEARIVGGELEVKGRAPVKIDHPAADMAP